MIESINKLKASLLSLGFVKDNQYLYNYCELIILNYNTERVSFSTNSHHIVPRCFYKYFNLDVNNNNENLVNLFFIDHIRAHWLLAHCASTSYFYYANIAAVQYMSGKYQVSAENIFDSPEFCALVTEDYKNLNKYKSIKFSGRGNPHWGVHTNYGGCFRGPHSETTRKKISLRLKGKVSNRLGIIMSQEQKLKISQALKQFYTVEENLKQHAVNAVKAWETRRRNNTTNTTNGMHIYNNGEKEIRAYSSPEGYVKGMLPKNRDAVSKSLHNYRYTATEEQRMLSIKKQQATRQNWSPEYREDVIERTRQTVITYFLNEPEEKRQARIDAARKGLQKYHASLTFEEKQLRNKKNSDGQRGKTRYKCLATGEHKMFVKGEAPDGWALIQRAPFMNTLKNRRVWLDADAPHESHYIPLDIEEVVR